MKYRNYLLYFFIVLFLSVSANACVQSNNHPKTDDQQADVTNNYNEDSSERTFYQPTTIKKDYQLPTSLTLCGERVPLELQSVRERLEHEFILVANHPAQIELWRRRAKRYFPLIEESLKKAGLPDDLKYLAVAESDLRPDVFSPSGAGGIWQFMPATAKRFGLQVNKDHDQRLLPERLLSIGEQYLKSLYEQFGSWFVAMAAYNAGEGRLARAIAKQRTKNYFQLDLPRETERYVYRIAAIKIVLENNSLYNNLPKAPSEHYQPKNFQEQNIIFEGHKTWSELSQKHKISYKELRQLNPHLLKHDLKGGPYTVRLPK